MKQTLPPRISHQPQFALADSKVRATSGNRRVAIYPPKMASFLYVSSHAGRASANFRMITSYWDMASSFVLNGAIDEKMFFDSGTEHIFVYAKIQPFLAEIRQLFQEPDFLINLETLAMKAPNIEAKLESRKRLAAIWAKDEKELSAAESN